MFAHTPNTRNTKVGQAGAAGLGPLWLGVLVRWLLQSVENENFEKFFSKTFFWKISHSILGCNLRAWTTCIWKGRVPADRYTVTFRIQCSQTGEEGGMNSLWCEGVSAAQILLVFHPAVTLFPRRDKKGLRRTPLTTEKNSTVFLI